MTSRTVVLTGLLLLVLAGVSLALSIVDLGAWRVPVALAIAAVKALVVAGAFMELRREAPAVHLGIAAGLAMLLLLVGLTSADVLTR